MIGTKACIKGGHFVRILRRGPKLCWRQMVCSNTAHPFIDAEAHPVIGAVQQERLRELLSSEVIVSA